MKKAILEIYALAVCFFTVACLAITLGIAIYDAIQIANPEFTVDNYEFERHQSNDTFKKQLSPCDKENAELVLTGDELTRKREESWALTLRSEKHEGTQSLVRMLIIMLVSTLVFVVHWRIARRSRDSVST